MAVRKYLVDVDLGQNHLLNAVLDSTNAPAVAGMFGYNTGTNRVRYHNGTAPKDLVESGAVVNTDIAAGAAIAYSKLALALSIQNSDVSNSAAIAYSKLNLATSIVNGDIAGAAAIAYSKLNLTGSVLYGDMAASAFATTGTASKLAAWDSSGMLSNANAPTAGNHLVNKTYVDAVSSGKRAYKDPCRVATTAAFASITQAGTGAGATLTNAGTQAAISIDGVALSLNDRVLVKNQATGSQNGIYTVTTVGSGSVNWVLTRAVDADGSTNGSVIEGMFLLVDEGTTNSNTAFVMTTTGAITVDTTTQTFTAYSRAEVITAGTYLTRTGNSIAHNNSGVTAGTYIGFTLDAQGHTTGVTLPTTLAGFGITDAPKKYTMTLVGGTSVTAVTVSAGGSGYPANGTGVTITFSAPQNAGGVTAVGSITINGSGVVTAVTVSNGGTGYTSDPTITINGGGGGSGATFTYTRTATNKFTVPHSLGTRNVITTIREAQGTYDDVTAGVTITDPTLTNMAGSAGAGINNLEIQFSTAPASGTNYMVIAAG